MNQNFYDKLKNATQNQRHEYSTLKKYSQRSFEPIKK